MGVSMENEKPAGKIGDAVRAVGALATTGAAINWYNGVKDNVFGKVISDLGSSLTADIMWPFAVYGAGEAINVYNKFHGAATEIYGHGTKWSDMIFPSFTDFIGGALRIAPLVSPVIAYKTNNDFLDSILVPAAMCIVGHGVEYVSNMFRKSD